MRSHRVSSVARCGRFFLLLGAIVIVGAGVWLVWRWFFSPLSSTEVTAKAEDFARAFARGDCQSLWRYASKEEKERWSVDLVERLYRVFITEELGGVRLYSGQIPYFPRKFVVREVSRALWRSGRGDYQSVITLQSKDGSVILATLRLRTSGRRVEASVGQFFLEVARGYAAAHIPWEDQKTSRWVVGLEKFKDVFRSAGVTEFYEFRTQAWFTLEEWEAFARSGRMIGTGFD